MTVAVVGSINADLVFTVKSFPRPGETLLAKRFAQGLGGKGANQAVAAARMGASTSIAGGIGDDATGHGLLARLQAEGIDLAAVDRVRGTATGLASIYVSKGENTVIVAAGANGAFDGCVPTQLVESAAKTTVLFQFEIPLPAVEAAALALAASPRLILNAAPAVANGDRLFPLFDMLVLNRPEIDRYAPPAAGEEDIAALVARAAGLRTGRLRTVLVTLGAQGSLAITHDGTVFVPALPVAAIDTVGAGDCFCGVLAAELDAGGSLERAMAAATAAASITVQRPGAAAAMPYRAEVLALLSA